MKNFGYFETMMRNNTEHDYVVLARGFRPFATDNIDEAKEDAASKASFSCHVTVQHIDGYPVVEYRNGYVVK